MFTVMITQAAPSTLGGRSCIKMSGITKTFKVKEFLQHVMFQFILIR